VAAIFSSPLISDLHLIAVHFLGEAADFGLV
jgi:hypothetical protein